VIQHVERVDSAKKIQRWWRLKRPNRPKVADVARMWSRAQTVISKHLRGYFARKEYERSLDAVVTFQKMCRGRADRKMLQKRHNAAIVIEKHARGFVAKKGYKRLRENVIRMQSFYRAKRAALEANVKYNFAMVIQASARGWQVRRAVRVQKKAILDIQKCYRGYLGRKSVEEMKGSRTRRDGEARGRGKAGTVD
jgi:myosin heavy subunit